MEGNKIKEVVNLIYTKLGKIDYTKPGKLILEIIFVIQIINCIPCSKKFKELELKTGVKIWRQGEYR